TFTTTAVGATASSAMISRYSNALRPAQVPPPPEMAPPVTYMAVTIKVPQPGTYTFGFTFWQDSSGPTVSSVNAVEEFAGGQFLHEWGGGQCTSATMQAQLPPPTDPPTHLICPGPPAPWTGA
ncbi:MAG TPA: hypothetical protein VGR57_21710, partial [Ktedonobacterales bacterium]|nr:hypothetical protein [Ktedonobacterales bacterium]